MGSFRNGQDEHRGPVQPEAYPLKTRERAKKLEPQRSRGQAAELAEKIGRWLLHDLIEDSLVLRSWVLGRLCSRQERFHSELRVKFEVGIRFLFERGQAAR
jgi:hypothetical protein